MNNHNIISPKLLQVFRNAVAPHKKNEQETFEF